MNNYNFTKAFDFVFIVRNFQDSEQQSVWLQKKANKP